MKLAINALAAVLACGILSQSALASEEIAKKSGCTVCHATDKKLVGPSFKQVADKYRGDAGAPAQLADKVRKGGKGVWGPIPMLPNDAAKISDADLSALLAWILKL